MNSSPKCLCKQICYYFCVNPKCKQPNAFICKNKKYQCMKPHQNCTLKLWGKFSQQLKDMKYLFQMGQKCKKLMDEVDNIFKYWQNQYVKQKEQYMIWKNNYMSISLFYKFQKDLRQSNEKKWTGEQLSFLIRQPHIEKLKCNFKNKQPQKIIMKVQDIGRSIKNLYDCDTQSSFMSQINKSVISTRSKINSKQQQLQNSMKKTSLTHIKFEEQEPEENRNNKNLKYRTFHSLNCISPTKNNITTIQEQKEEYNNIKNMKRVKNASTLQQSAKNKMKQYQLNRSSYRSLSKLDRQTEKSNFQNQSCKILSKIKSSSNFEKFKNQSIQLKLKQIYLQQINKKLRIMQNLGDSLQIKFVKCINYLACNSVNQLSRVHNQMNQLQKIIQQLEQQIYKIQIVFDFLIKINKNVSIKILIESFTEFVDILKQFKFSKLKYIKLYYPHCITLENSKFHQNLSNVLSRLPKLQLFLIITSQKNFLIKTYQNLGSRAKILVQNNWNMKEKWQ